AAAGETLNPEKPLCGRRRVQRLDTHHGLDGMGRWLVPTSSGIKANLVPAWDFQTRLGRVNHDGGSARRPTPPETMMRFYNQPHRFYCGVDLHARTLSLCVLDSSGALVRQATMAATPAVVLDALAPFRDGLVVGCECMFAWYWLADLCTAEKIDFVLGH